MQPLDKTYDTKRVEEKWLATWLERNAFHSDSTRGGTPYCIVIPPPNVTGILHMGHALNNTIQDILARWRRMQGRNVVWMPGTDHAGIATQNVVERALRKEGKHREDLGREAFVQRVWEWRSLYGSTIINQLKRLGASCDWERERFTMDEALSDAVAEVFVRLYNKGLIYKAKYIINWCPRCRTALSDEESEHQDMNGQLYHIRYPFAPGSAAPQPYIVVATTRPETLLGDTAVAVNPADERYKALIGRTLLLPVLQREIPIIADDFVDPKFGTGLVKVTPAHDPNDFQMGLRHNLPQIDVMNDDGTMNAEAGPYAGMDRFDCRKRILADLEAAGLIEKIEPHQNAVGHCYRCHTIVEPRLSPQWFVKMKPLAGPAIEAVRSGRVQFVPARWTKVYLDWMENIRDWCISRQIWWGHRIPVFYCDGCSHEWVAKGKPNACPKCGAGSIRQDEDVLDTWFSSWLWPFSTFGWPQSNPDLKFYYPTEDLVTASEIIFFWVARMVVAGSEFMGDIPFRRVYIHGTVRDDVGRKMSKSLGNSIDPLSIIDQYSADALRFSLIMLTATGQDVHISTEKFEIGRNFGTKLWNAARFMQMHTKPEHIMPGQGNRLPPLDPALLSADDKHVLLKLQDTMAAVTDNLEKFRFNDAALALYDFLWHQFCDWYIEYAKEALYGDAEARRNQVVGILHYVFSSSLLLLHPIMPFLTEELWQAMGYGKETDLIMLSRWPEALDGSALQALGISREVAAYVEDKHELIRAGRQLRADYNIPPSEKLDFLVRPSSEQTAEWLRSDAASIQTLLKASSLTVDTKLAEAKAMPSGVVPLGTIYMSVAGHIDVEAEISRLAAQLEKIAADLKRVDAKLGNPDFVNKAKPEVVDAQKTKKLELQESASKLEKLITTLSSLRVA
jgi:valyl-tRNA synthetase